MISQNRYVKIVSGVGAAVSVAQRKLILRLVTKNTLVPPGVVLEFQDSDTITSYFGAGTEESKRGLAYFAFISKNISSPATLSFVRWVSAAIAPQVVGDAFSKSLSSFTTVVAGTLQILSGTTTVNITGMTFAGAASLTAVAALIQTAVRASADAALTLATVTYNTNTNQFVLTGGVVGPGSIAVVATGLATDISQITGLATGGAVIVAGQVPDSAALAISKSAGVSNNFGSFAYVVPYASMTLADVTEVAAWNAAQNNAYIYTVPVYLTDLAAYYGALKGFSGCAINILSQTKINDYVEQCPSEILAATDYTQPGAAQNFMFYQFTTRNVTVSDDPTADTCDKSRGNYIGVTQSSGAQLAFYQRGILCGGPNDAVDMNVYCNEMWLKSACSSTILTLFLAMPTVPADEEGAAMILGVLQPILTLAGDNGTFTTGKPLTAVQQQYITRVSGDKNAWRQVFSIGYWIDISFSPYVNSNTGLTEWKATYKLIYSKGDAIRLVTGTDTMI